MASQLNAQLSRQQSQAQNNAPPFEGLVTDVNATVLTIDLGDLRPDLKGQRLRGRVEGRRIVPYFSRAELEAAVPALRQIAGNIAMPGFTAPKLAWVRRHEPEFFAQVRTVLLPKDYVRLYLTGEKASDLSDSAGTLWLDVAQRDWSDELLAATGLTRAHMPRLYEGSELTGSLRADVAARWGMGCVPLAAGAGDNAAGAAGVGIDVSGTGAGAEAETFAGVTVGVRRGRRRLGRRDGPGPAGHRGREQPAAEDADRGQRIDAGQTVELHARLMTGADQPHRHRPFNRHLPGQHAARFDKHVHNAFTDTGLDVWLRRHGVQRLIISGIRTEQCCETTARVGSDLGYAVDFVSEATLTFPMTHQGTGQVFSAQDITTRTELVLANRFARIVTVDTCLSSL